MMTDRKSRVRSEWAKALLDLIPTSISPFSEWPEGLQERLNHKCVRDSPFTRSPLIRCLHMPGQGDYILARNLGNERWLTVNVQLAGYWVGPTRNNIHQVHVSPVRLTVDFHVRSVVRRVSERLCLNGMQRQSEGGAHAKCLAPVAHQGDLHLDASLSLLFSRWGIWIPKSLSNGRPRILFIDASESHGYADPSA